MTYEPKPVEVARLLALLGRGGAALQKDLKPKLEKPEREALVAAGFLREEKRARGALHVELTDAAWAWAQGHLDAKTSLTGGAGVILHDWLGRLRRYMDATGVSLAEILCPRETAAADGAAQGAPLETKVADFEAVRAAAIALGGGRANVRVRLKDLRRALVDVPRADLDHLLRAAAGRGRLALYALDDPLDCTAEDEAAAIDLGGRPAHILYVK